jgi:hypothetical protein
LPIVILFGFPAWLGDWSWTLLDNGQLQVAQAGSLTHIKINHHEDGNSSEFPAITSSGSYHFCTGIDSQWLRGRPFPMDRADFSDCELF